ncbi:MAG TPA: hypothetical protein VEU72_02880 [Nitrosopumilaceae archaeon]|nr:hypothetical protein [Nitrosopumilaceae archaeon]
MIVISVSKRWYHPRSEVRQHGKNGAKKRWFVFYFDEEYRFRTKRIHWSEVLWYKSQKHHKRRYICIRCGQKLIAFVRNPKETVECPYCD